MTVGRGEERQKSWTAGVSDRVMRLKLESEYVIVVVRGDAPGAGRQLGEKVCAGFNGHVGASGRDGQDLSQDRILEGRYRQYRTSPSRRVQKRSRLMRGNSTRGTTSSEASQHRTVCEMVLVVRTVKMTKTEERTKWGLKKESCVFQGRAQTGCWSGASGDWTAMANVNRK